MMVLKDIPKMSGNYQLTCSAIKPQLIVFLLDCGRTMAEGIHGKSKMEIACRIINRLITRLTIANINGPTIRNRYHIAVLGYGDDYQQLCSGSLSDLFDNPLRIEETMQEVADGAGGFINVLARSAIFVDTTAQNNVSKLSGAIIYARSFIEKWLADKKEVPAPIVVNISDGINIEVSPLDNVTSSIESLRELPSFDGPSLFYSMIIGSEVEISVLNRNASYPNQSPLQTIVSCVPNNHCQCIYFSYNPENFDSTHSPLIGITTNENELYAIINASAGFGRAHKLE